MAKKFIVIIHHSAVSYAKNPDQFAANNEYHRKLWNFRSKLGFYLGYNYEISKDGLVRKAREIGESTAACYQLGLNNRNSINICMDGNFDIEKPDDKQIYALRDLLKKLVANGQTEKDLIYFHRTFALNTKTGQAYKTCPGKNMDLCFIRSLVNA